MDANKKVWGFLRETTEEAEKAGLDKDTGLPRTGLEEYLKVIFPKVDDWVHDKIVDGLEKDGQQCRYRPDYRSEALKLIIEFDGIPHYTKPDTIETDYIKTKFYLDKGYKVVRIPYFIQLTKEAVKKLFDVDIDCELFDVTVPSLGIKGQNTPAYLCPAGIKRMASEFKQFPEQYEVNLNFLKKQNDIYKTGIDFLESVYNS